jgi:hypothetical protein
VDYICKRRKMQSHDVILEMMYKQEERFLVCRFLNSSEVHNFIASSKRYTAVPLGTMSNMEGRKSDI